MKKLLIYMFLAVMPIYAFGQDPKYKTLDNVYYYDSQTVDQTDYMKQKCLVDIYYPESKAKVPVVIWFHGGGLTGGKKEIPSALKNKGFCVIGVGYRLSPKVKAETCIADATAAIAWVFKNIDRYNGDPNQIIVSGHSAGGYLALMSVMDKSWLKKYNIDSDKVAGLVPFSGHTITHFTIRKEQGIPGEQPIIDKWAPLFHVRKNAPPTLLITGDREKEMLGRYEENAYFYRMMKVVGHPNITQYEMDGYGHNMTEPAFPLLVDFVSLKSKVN
ncbi:alpha/beta hydrolase [Arenibacter sp. BSSL-BM3]|uniref:Alpha/beta hydrolase n=1 Tax=Arenibacter arenosicollis TaxID=2762274 RepID=A0ABR7QMV5_9FLAO|nr:alpha/beta hydrolase [Arenibacter arenosicollis]MBC8768522.1 alpha/beta hydrolase [Arenibacter arenosicollis]